MENDFPRGNGYDKDKRWVRSTLEDHSRLLRSIDARVRVLEGGGWRLLKDVGMVLLTAAVTWYCSQAWSPRIFTVDDLVQALQKVEMYKAKEPQR